MSKRGFEILGDEIESETAPLLPETVEPKKVQEEIKEEKTDEKPEDV